MAPTGTAANEGTASQSYVVSYNVPELPKKPTQLRLSYDPWSCVSYAKYKRPDQNFIWKAPKYVEAYDIQPQEGLLVITNEGPVGHVAYVTAVGVDSITVTEANYISGKVTARTIPQDATIIRGYR